LAVIIFWWAFASLLDRLIVPYPWMVFINIKQIFADKMEIHQLYSLGRIMAGIAFSVLAGVPLGYLMGYYARIDKVLSPLVYFTYPVPKLALLPIVMLLFGLGELSKLTMIVLIVIFQIIITSRVAVKSIPAETFHSLGPWGPANFSTLARSSFLPLYQKF
jgi:NitT/TauT family transport system permease protein